MIFKTDIIKTFSYACFIAMITLLLCTIGFEIFGKNGLYLANRSFEFAIYSIFALGLYKIIERLEQLIGEMKYFRQHYILKDKEREKNE